MDFFDQEALARKRTRLLLCLFGLAVCAFVVLTYVILAVPIRFFSPALATSTGFFQFIWDPRLAFWVTAGTLFSTALGCFYKMRLLSGGGPAVAELLGGRKTITGCRRGNGRRRRRASAGNLHSRLRTRHQRLCRRPCA
jgi:hypothetical protein